jgi:SAM-dependent methyltransferase
MISDKNSFDYSYLSKIYDTCMSSFWVNYANLVSLFLSVENKNVLDLGCGTGLAVQFLRCKSKQYVGVDLSSEMLAVAREKFPDHLFFEKSILDLELSKEFDLVISAFDTINHFINPADWKRVFEIASKHLSPTGFFIFDVVSIYDHEINWPDQVNFTESEEWIYFQRSGFNTKSKRALIKNTIFQKKETNWIRLEETIEQISLPTAIILNLLANTGLTCLKILDLETGQNATETSATLFFVCKSSK